MLTRSWTPRAIRWSGLAWGLAIAIALPGPAPTAVRQATRVAVVAYVPRAPELAALLTEAFSGRVEAGVELVEEEAESWEAAARLLSRGDHVAVAFALDGTWAVRVSGDRLGHPFENVVPTAFAGEPGAIAALLVPILQLMEGRAEEALVGFHEAESVLPARADAIFWSAAALARLQRLEEALDQYRIADGGDFTAGPAVQAELDLALTRALALDAEYDPDLAVELQARIVAAVERLRPWDARGWAAATIAATDLTLRVAPVDDLEHAERLLRTTAGAERGLRLPRDTAAQAGVESLLARIRLRLADRVDEPEIHLELAIEHLRRARAAYLRLDEEHNAEAVDHVIRRVAYRLANS